MAHYSSRGSMQFSRSKTFHFEAVRALWSAPFDGSDYGEVAATMTQVRAGRFESWYHAWSRTAHAIAGRAEGLADPTSRGRALLRASTYMREAEFYLPADDARRAAAAVFCRDVFDGATYALGVDVTRTRISYAGAEMEALFARPTGSSTDTALVVHGGFDSTLEELYFTIGAGAAERGYPVLMYTGPGQGNLLREYGLPFRPDWEIPASTAIDAIEGMLPRPHRIVGVGISFGGHLLARAAAFEPRYAGIVLFDYFPGMLDAFLHKVPRPFHQAFLRMPRWMRAVLPLYLRMDSEARWGIDNALWTFGATGLEDLIEHLRGYDESIWSDRIRADTLVLLGEREQFYDTALAHRFVQRLSGAKSVTLREFTAAEGGHLHCQNGAIHLAHEAIFDWLRITNGA